MNQMIIESTIIINDEFNLKIEIIENNYVYMTLIKKIQNQFQMFYHMLNTNKENFINFITYFEKKIKGNYFRLTKIDSNIYELILFDYSKCNSNPKTSFLFLDPDDTISKNNDDDIFESNCYDNIYGDTNSIKFSSQFDLNSKNDEIKSKYSEKLTSSLKSTKQQKKIKMKKVNLYPNENYQNSQRISNSCYDHDQICGEINNSNSNNFENGDLIENNNQIEGVEIKEPWGNLNVTAIMILKNEFILLGCKENEKDKIKVWNIKNSNFEKFEISLFIKILLLVCDTLI